LPKLTAGVAGAHSGPGYPGAAALAASVLRAAAARGLSGPPQRAAVGDAETRDERARGKGVMKNFN